jgi:hypothetical protein
MSGTTVPVAPAPPPALITLVSSDNITLLVRTVKNMRELGCEAFLGEQDAEITGRWLRKVESVMTQMRVPDDWQVSCATQLLSDRAQTWWEVIQSRRIMEFVLGASLGNSLRPNFSLLSSAE